MATRTLTARNEGTTPRATMADVHEQGTWYQLEVGFYDVEETEDGERVRVTDAKTEKYTHLYDMDQVLARVNYFKGRDGKPEKVIASHANRKTMYSVWTRHYTMFWVTKSTSYSIGL